MTKDNSDLVDKITSYMTHNFSCRANMGSDCNCGKNQAIYQLKQALQAPRVEQGGLHVPGLLKCKKCGCEIIKQSLNMGDGSVTANNEPDNCPNGCGPMWKVSERDARIEAQKAFDNAWEQWHQEEKNHEQTIKERDHWHDRATVLAETVGRLYGVEVGEHTSANCPVENALNIIIHHELPSQPDDTAARHEADKEMMYKCGRSDGHKEGEQAAAQRIAKAIRELASDDGVMKVSEMFRKGLEQAAQIAAQIGSDECK